MTFDPLTATDLELAEVIARAAERVGLSPEEYDALVEVNDRVGRARERAEMDHGGRAELASGPFVTKTGRVLTDADVDALADEAERGYDIAALTEEDS